MKQPIPIKIAGLGRYLPERIVPNHYLEARCNLPTGWIERWCGVQERRWVDGETSSFMGAEAAKEAVVNAGLQLSDIDLIINASGTPEQAIPDGGPLIQRHLGLGRSGIPCFTVHATCLSFLAALDLSTTLLITERYRNILIVSSDIASVGLNFNEPESAALMGDAAAAAVVTLTPVGEASQLCAARLETYGVGANFTEIRGGGSRLHPRNPNTCPQDNLFHMEGTKVLRLVKQHAPAFLERLRPGLSKSLGNIRWVIPHQASLAGVRSLQHFGWPHEQIAVTLTQLGNCIAASIPATLYEIVHHKQLQRGDTMLLVGTGAGLSFGGIILQY